MSKLLLAVLMALTLAACGDTAQERMLTGGLIGAGTGALLGGMTTPNPHHPHFPVGPYGRSPYE